MRNILLASVHLLDHIAVFGLLQFTLRLCNFYVLFPIDLDSRFGFRCLRAVLASLRFVKFQVIHVTILQINLLEHNRTIWSSRDCLLVSQLPFQCWQRRIC